MKNIITLSLLLIPILGFAQVNVDGIDINRLEHVKYIELVASNKAFSQKVVIRVDYGQAVSFGEVQRITDGKGRKKAFNSVMDALNFMHTNGWEYLNSYVLTEGGNTPNHEVHYLMQKRAEPED